MKLSKEVLRVTCPNLKDVDRIVDVFNQYNDEYAINTPMRIAHFLAQVSIESGEFRYKEELASGKAYEHRADLGNNMPGDGVKYKGRGFIQITGKNNYKRFGDYIKKDLVNNPKLLAETQLAMESAMWFWIKGSRENLNTLADFDEYTKIRKRINGGVNGLGAGLKYLGKAKRALGLLK